MNHQTLGDIALENGNGDPVARVAYCDRKVVIRIITDDVPFEETLDLAASVAKRLAQLDTAAKQIAAVELTETYNNGWNEYDEAQEDGTFKAVSNPKLTESQFSNKLTLVAVNVTGGTMLDFFYEDENMFWGHSVVVTSMNGIELTETHAEIFG